jgi:ribosome assembly protein 1
MNVEIAPREINNRDPRSTLQAILRKWLPLPDAILRMIVRVVPNPIQAQNTRINNLLPNPSALAIELNSSKRSSVDIIRRVYEDVRSCSIGSEAEVTMFISKLTPIRAGDLSPIDLQMLREKRQRLSAQLEADDKGSSQANDAIIDSSTEVFMALGRIFSGVISRDRDLYILGSRHDPLAEDVDSNILAISSEHKTQKKVQRLAAGSFGIYICLGPSAYPVDKAYAGNIVGIIGLEDYVFKTGTICSTEQAYPMKAITFQAKPMLKVALETPSHLDLPKLAKGLDSLYQYDPVVEVGIDDSGQHTMTCLGELHLELCLKTLIEKFAKCEVKASEPLVSFRETVLPVDGSDTTLAINWLPSPWKDLPLLEHSHHGRCKLIVASNNLSISFRCFPLPLTVAAMMEDSNMQVTMLADYLNKAHNRTSDQPPTPVLAYWTKLQQLIKEASSSCDPCLRPLNTALDRLIAFGPKNVGPNLMIFDPNAEILIHAATVSGSKRGPDSISVDEPSSSKVLARVSLTQREVFYKLWNRIRGSIIAGFQFASSSGPIMNEPLHGVGFAIEDIAFSYSSISSDLSESELQRSLQSTEIVYEDRSLATAATGSQIMTGQLISEVRDVLRLCMLSCPMRVVEPIYACELQCDQAQLGNLYSVLAKRRGEVQKVDIIDGTSLFLLSVYLPVVESFSFTQELLNKTSGIGTAPQLRFSHWTNMETDPFWKAKTEKELEEYGAQGMEVNKVRILIDKIRKRKGLPIDEKIVVSAEKQRNMRK